MAIKSRKFTKGIRVKGTTDAATLDGEIRNDSAAKKIKVYLDTDGTDPAGEREVVTSDQTQTLSNKSIDADTNTVSNIKTSDLKAGVLNTNLAGAATDTELPSALAVKTALDGQNQASEITYTQATPADWTVADGSSTKATLDEVGSRLTSNETSQSTTDTKTNDLVTLSGVAANSADLGTFTGTTITDNSTEKVALQELETAVESKIGNSSTDTLTNKTIDASLNTLTNLTHGTEVDNPTSGVHGVTGNVVGTSDTQTLTGKTITAAGNTISGLTHGTEVDNPSSGVHGVVGAVVGTTDAQVITGKDIDGGTASNTSRITLPKDSKTNLDALARKQGTLVYDSGLDKVYKDDGVNLVEIGGSGQGGINYLEGDDTNFENTIGSWTGSANIAVSRTTGAGLLRGSGSLLLSKAAVDASTQVVRSITFTVEPTDLAKKLTISFDKDFSDANYSDDDMRVQITQDPAGTPKLIRVNGEDIKGGKGVHYAQFQTDAIVNTYKMEIYQVSTSATATAVSIDNVIIGPSEVVSQIVQNVNNFAAEIANSGAASIVNQTTDDYGNNPISSVSRTSLGVVSVTFTTGFFISTPVVVLDQTEIVNRTSTVTSISTTGFTVDTRRTDTAALEDRNFNFMVHRNGSDYNAPYAGSTSSDLGGREIIVEGAGNGDTPLTANSTDIDFTETRDTTNSWNGTQFTAPETGEYLVDGMIKLTASTTGSVRAYINTVGDKYVGAGANNGNNVIQISGKIKLNKDDVLSFRMDTASTLVNQATTNHISITKLASPQTILETETVAVRAKNGDAHAIANATVTTIHFNLVDFDTHGGLNTNTGEYTVPNSGLYHCNYTITFSDASSRYVHLYQGYIYVNGVLQKVNAKAGVGYDVVQNYRYSMEISDILMLNKGDVIDYRVYQNTGGTEALISSSSYNVMSIHRIK